MPETTARIRISCAAQAVANEVLGVLVSSPAHPTALPFQQTPETQKYAKVIEGCRNRQIKERIENVGFMNPTLLENWLENLNLTYVHPSLSLMPHGGIGAFLLWKQRRPANAFCGKSQLPGDSPAKLLFINRQTKHALAPIPIKKGGK